MRYKHVNKRCYFCGKKDIHRVVIMRESRRGIPKKRFKTILYLCDDCRRKEIEKRRRIKLGKSTYF